MSRGAPNGARDGGDPYGPSNLLLTMHARNETYRGARGAHVVTR